LICDDLLEPRILLLEILQSLGLVHPHPVVLPTPPIVRLCGHPELPAGLRDPLAPLQQDLRLTSLGDDLLGAVSLLLDEPSLPPGQPRIVGFGLDRNQGGRSPEYMLTRVALSFRNLRGRATSPRWPPPTIRKRHPMRGYFARDEIQPVLFNREAFEKLVGI
jgi:hypothetical protein